MYIERLQRVAAERRAVIGLGGGLPAAELFPRTELARAFATALRRSASLQYGWPEGSPGLREWIASRLRARGADVRGDDVLVTHGAQQALAIATQLLATRGAEIEVDAETYPAALDLFRASDARPSASCEAPAFVYLMPGVTNPRGVGLDEARRRALLARGVALLTDEAYAELRFDGVVPRPLLCDARDRTWHVGTVSKTLCPGLRVGWLVPPRAHLDRARALKHACDLQAGSLAQAVLEELVTHDDFDARLARARRFYRARADALMSAIRRHLPGARVREPEGGFSVWVELERDDDEATVLSRATELGVSFDPGSLFRFDGRDAPLSMRLCHSSHGRVALQHALTRLGRVIAA